MRAPTGDGGPALDAAFDLPQGDAATPAGGIAAASDGRLFIADTYNHRVRVVGTDGVIRTIAGIGEAGTGADGGRALETAIDRPSDVAIGPDDALYIADTGNSCVRRLDEEGRLVTVAGRCGERGDGDDGAPAVDTLLDRPYSIAFDEEGDLYIADTHNHRVRVVGAHEVCPRVPLLTSWWRGRAVTRRDGSARSSGRTLRSRHVAPVGAPVHTAGSVPVLLPHP